MKTIPEILDHIKAKTGIKNDYNLGLKIGVSTGATFEFRHNKSIPSDETCIKLANLAGEDPEKIILIAHAARAKSKEATKIWNSILKKAIGFSIVIILLSPTLLFSFQKQHILYIMSNGWNKLKTFLKRLFNLSPQIFYKSIIKPATL